MAKFGSLSLAAAAAALLVGTSAAHAVVTAQFISVGTPNVGTGLTPNGLMTGWTAYVLRLTSSTGNVTGFDFSNVAITGTMAQLQTTNPDTGLPQTTPLGGASNGGTGNPGGTAVANNSDSHFLNTLTESVGVNFAENFTGAGNSPYAASNSLAGVGTSLSGAAGIQAVSQAQSVDIAYVVVQNGTSVGFIGASASDAPLGGGGSVANLITASASPVAAPEPASLGVLALGGLALLARRRKA